MAAGQIGFIEDFHIPQLQLGVTQLILQEKRNLLHQVFRGVPVCHRHRSRKENIGEQQEPQYSEAVDPDSSNR